MGNQGLVRRDTHRRQHQPPGEGKDGFGYEEHERQLAQRTKAEASSHPRRFCHRHPGTVGIGSSTGHRLPHSGTTFGPELGRGSHSRPRDLLRSADQILVKLEPTGARGLCWTDSSPFTDQFVTESEYEAKTQTSKINDIDSDRTHFLDESDTETDATITNPWYNEFPNKISAEEADHRVRNGL